MQLWGNQRRYWLHYGISRKKFLVYYYIKMAKKDYSVEEKVALIKDAEKIYSEFYDKSELLKATRDVYHVFVQCLNWMDKVDQCALDTVLKASVEVVEEELKDKLLVKDYDLMRVWLWQIIWVIKWDEEAIKRLLATLDDIRKDIKDLDNIPEDKEKEIAKITAEIKVYFNKK